MGRSPSEEHLTTRLKVEQMKLMPTKFPLMVVLLVLYPSHLLAQQATIDVLDQFTPLGNATLSNAVGGLSISNVGTSGQDGAGVDVLAATSGVGAVNWSSRLLPTTSLGTGSVLTHAVTGIRDGMVASSTLERRMTTTGGLEFDATFSPGELIDIKFLDTSGDLQFVESVPAEGTFRATIEVIGDGTTLLDTRDIFFLVPPVPIDIPIEAKGRSVFQRNWFIEFNGTVSVNNSIGTSLGQGTGLLFTENPSGGFHTITAASITGTNLSQIVISESTVTLVPEPAALGMLVGFVSLVMVSRIGRTKGRSI